MLTQIHVWCALGQNRFGGLYARPRNRHTVIIYKQLFGLRGPRNGCFQRNQTQKRLFVRSLYVPELKQHVDK